MTLALGQFNSLWAQIPGFCCRVAHNLFGDAKKPGIFNNRFANLGKR